MTIGAFATEIAPLVLPDSASSRTARILLPEWSALQQATSDHRNI
jgi:hypothetical protein